MKKTTPLAFAFTLVAAAAIAPIIAAGSAGADPKDGDRPHRRPPPAAFDACKGKQAKDACEVTFGERKITGACLATPEGPLACRSDRPFGPPPELIAACAKKSEGATCQATLGDRVVDGKCQKGRHGDQLVCHRPRDGEKRN